MSRKETEKQKLANEWCQKRLMKLLMKECQDCMAIKESLFKTVYFCYIFSILLFILLFFIRPKSIFLPKYRDNKNLPEYHFILFIVYNFSVSDKLICWSKSLFFLKSIKKLNKKMSSGFITESEIAEAKRVRQEEWDKVRNKEDPEEVIQC